MTTDADQFEAMKELQRAADMAGLEMEFLELRQDALRYRWLRSGAANMHQVRAILNDTPTGIDAAVDKARLGTRKSRGWVGDRGSSGPFGPTD